MSASSACFWLTVCRRRSPEGLSRNQLAATMALDKKAEGSKVNVVLLTQIGACTGMLVDSGKLAQML